MKIGFDAKRLYCNFTGLGNYSRSLVKNLHQFYPGNDYFLYTPRLKINKENSWFYDNPSLQTHVAKTPFKSFWRSFSMINQLDKDEIDLYHGLSNEIPYGLKKKNTKSVVTIHDLIFKHLPETFPWVDRKIYDLKFQKSCQAADKIIAISESTKKDIVHFYGIDPDKIKVIYQSCNPLFYTNQERANMPGALKKYNLPSEFLLFVGSLEKRKNPELIVEAFEYLSPENKIPLVFVGRGKDYKKKLNQLVTSRGLEKYVIWVSDLEDNNHLQVIYQNATALIYPSLYEGFGLPVVEALLSKIPVITSKFSSLPEAGGPGSVYVNPTKAEELAHAISKVLGDSDLRNNMIANGYDYARKMFSPVHVSEQMTAFYSRLVNK